MTFPAFGQVAMKVGYVNMKKAINVSNEGKRSRKFLEAKIRQTQSDLKAKEQEVLTKEADLKNNIMLNQEAKIQKRQDIKRLKLEFKKDLGKAQQSMRQDELRYTQKIIKEIALVVKDLAKEEGYDLILELNALNQIVLFSKNEMTDLTEKVTKRYNQMQAIQ